MRLCCVGAALFVLWCPLAAQNGFGVTITTTEVRCAGERNGGVLLRLSNGAGPVRYDWTAPAVGGQGSTGELNVQTPSVYIDSLAKGTYRFVFTQPNGLFKIEWVSVPEPPAIQSSITAQGDRCLDEHKGIIDIGNIEGGYGPYKVVFDGNAPDTVRHWENLHAGQYFLTILDDRGCRKEEGVVLPTGLEFNFDLGADTTIYSGDTLPLAFSSNRRLESVKWVPERYAFTVNPDSAKLFPPIGQTFKAYAVDENGCAAEDSKSISVQQRRQVFAPNAFAPRLDGDVNSMFGIHVGGGVAAVELLQVLDRAGRVWCSFQDLTPEQAEFAWDGSYGGRYAPQGVYVWQARLRYSDGRMEWFQGDVAVVR